MGQSLYGFAFRRTRAGSHRLINRIQRGGILRIQRPYIDLAPSDVLRWKLAYQGLQKYPGLFYYPSSMDYAADGCNNTRKLHRRYLNEYVTDRVRNWPNMRLVRESSDHDATGLFLSLSVAGLLYGGLHLSAWNAPFRSAIESLLWRISSVSIAVSGIVLITALLFAALFFFLAELPVCRKISSWLTRMEQVRNPIGLFLVIIIQSSYLALALLFYPVTLGIFALYIFSRIYLLVECFLGIPYLPLSVLEVPRWSHYFPHLG